MGKSHDSEPAKTKTIIKKGFLLGNDTSVKPQTPLIQEINSAKSISVLSPSMGSPPSGVTKVLSENVNQSIPPHSSASSAPIAPVITMKERGKIDIGDFESLNDKVLSNRPVEVVYRVELPLADKPSKITLDVAER